MTLHDSIDIVTDDGPRVAMRPRIPFMLGSAVGVVLLVVGSLMLLTSPSVDVAHSIESNAVLSLMPEAESVPGRRLRSGARATRVGRIVGVGGGDGDSGRGQMLQMVLRILVWLVWGIATLIFGAQYKSKVVDPIPVMQAKQQSASGGNLKFGLFDCFGKSQLCMHSCCCLAVRFGHNMQVAGLMGFWPAALLAYFCECCMCVIGPVMRAQLRQKLGLGPDGFMDFLKYCCCSVCAVAQDAMQIDEESGGVEVSCCCQLYRAQTTQAAAAPCVATAVGQPIYVGQEVLQKEVNS